MRLTTSSEHKCGTKATNALSDHYVLCCRVTKDNYDSSIKEVSDEFKLRGDSIQLYYYIEYSKGRKLNEGCKSLQELNDILKLEFIPEFVPHTFVYFKPDYSIIQSNKYDLPLTNLSLVKLIVKETLNSEVKYFIDNSDLEYELFSNRHNINLDASQSSNFNNSIKFLTSFEFEKDLSSGMSKGSVNSLVVNRGLHIREVENAIKNGLIEVLGVGESYRSYITKGLNLSVIVLTNEVGYSSQTKENLVSIDGWNSTLRNELTNSVTKFIKSNKDNFTEHYERVKEYVASLNKLKNMDFIKSKVILSSDIRRSKSDPEVLKKLRDCTSNDREKCTLYIVEGDSAGGSLIQARDNKYQAVMKMRGKPLNVLNRDVEGILENAEIRAIVNGLGVGIKGYELQGTPRFGKIVISTDAD